MLDTLLFVEKKSQVADQYSHQYLEFYNAKWLVCHVRRPASNMIKYQKLAKHSTLAILFFRVGKSPRRVWVEKCFFLLAKYYLPFCTLFKSSSSHSCWWNPRSWSLSNICFFFYHLIGHYLLLSSNSHLAQPTTSNLVVCFIFHVPMLCAKLVPVILK